VTVGCADVCASQPRFPRKLQPAITESKASSFPWRRLSGAQTELCRGNYQIIKQKAKPGKQWLKRHWIQGGTGSFGIY